MAFIDNIRRRFPGGTIEVDMEPDLAAGLVLGARLIRRYGSREGALAAAGFATALAEQGERELAAGLLADDERGGHGD